MKRKAYSLVEVAELLGISKSLAYDLAAKGVIPVVKLGKKRLIVPEEALEELLKKDLKRGD